MVWVCIFEKQFNFMLITFLPIYPTVTVGQKEQRSTRASNVRAPWIWSQGNYFNLA